MKVTAVTRGANIYYAELLSEKRTISLRYKKKTLLSLKRFPNILIRMNSILGIDETTEYVDLVCAFDNLDGVPIPTPPQVRYFTKAKTE